MTFFKNPIVTTSGGGSVTEFADLKALYAATPADGELCRVSWTGDAHVADGEIITRWNATDAEFQPSPLYQVEMPGWIFGQDWIVPPNQDLTGGVLDYVSGRPRISAPSNPGSLGFFLAMAPAIAEGAHGGIRCRIRYEDCNLSAAFHRSTSGLCPPDIEPDISVPGTYSNLFTVGKVSNTGAALFCSTASGSFTATTGGSCSTGDENWVNTVTVKDQPVSAGVLTSSTRCIGMSSSETLSTSLLGELTNLSGGNAIHGDRIALRPCMLHGVFGSGAGANTYRMTLLGLRILAPKVGFDASNYSE